MPRRPRNRLFSDAGRDLIAGVLVLVAAIAVACLETLP